MEMAEVREPIHVFPSLSLLIFVAIGEFGLWRPRKKGPYVWEIIPSTMPVALLRKGWGIEGDQTVSQLNAHSPDC